MNGKGDTPRPVDRKRFEANFLAIKWKRKARKHSNKLKRV